MSVNVKQTVKLIFPDDMIKEPVLWQVGRLFNVVSSILAASVEKDSGWIEVEITGTRYEINAALAYLKRQRIICELKGSHGSV